MKNNPKIIFAAAVCAVFVATDFMFPIMSSASSGTAQSVLGSSSVVILQLGNKSVLVAALQKLLIQKGFLKVAAPTGYFGAMTQAAVIATQKSQNLPQTGVMVIPTAALHSFFAAAAFNPSGVGSAGSQVNFVQQFLIQSGFLKVAAPTGYFGALTKAAVIAFQKAHNLPQTGIVNQGTFAAMGGK